MRDVGNYLTILSLNKFHIKTWVSSLFRDNPNRISGTESKEYITLSYTPNWRGCMVKGHSLWTSMTNLVSHGS